MSELLTKTLMRNTVDGREHEEVITWVQIPEGYFLYDRTIELKGEEGRWLQASVITLGRAKAYAAECRKWNKPVLDSLGDPVGEEVIAPKESSIWNPLSMALDEGWEQVSQRGAVAGKAKPTPAPSKEV